MANLAREAEAGDGRETIANGTGSRATALVRVRFLMNVDMQSFPAFSLFAKGEAYDLPEELANRLLRKREGSRQVLCERVTESNTVQAVVGASAATGEADLQPIEPGIVSAPAPAAARRSKKQREAAADAV